MWIEKTKTGKYKYVEQYTDYMTGRKKRASVTLEKNTAATRKTAMETLIKLIDERQSTPPEKKELTLKELVELYRKYQKQTVKASTYKRNYFACETLKSILGPDILVNNITANYIKDKFLTTDKLPGTLNEHRTRLKALLRWAYDNDYIRDISFVQKFKPFKAQSHKERISDKYLEPREIKLLLESMNCEKWRLFTEFLILSGLRIGEAIALTADDIDFNAHIIHVSKNYDLNNHIVTTPKTSCSIRDIYLQPELESLCKNINLYIKMEGLSMGYRTNLFICNKTGKHLNYDSYSKYLRENSEKALFRRITPHALRHTHASSLLAQGVSIDAISRRLGHDNSKVTRSIYLHITEQLKKADNAQLRDIKII